MSKRTEHDPSLVLDPEQARRLARALQSNPKLTPEAEAELQRRAEESRATLPPKPAAWSPGGANLFSGVVAGLFALLVMMTGEAQAQLCAATCLDVETLGAATVHDQETGTATMYDSCTYTDCACTDTDADSDPVWICCNVSTQHGWGSFGDGCASYSAGEVIVYGVDGAEPAPIPEPKEPTWSLVEWLGDLFRQAPEHSDHGGVILVDIWPEWHTRDAGLTQGEWGALLEAWGALATEDGADDTPTPDDPTEKLLEQVGWRSGGPLQVGGDDPTPSETPTDAPVEATPEPLVCPPGETPTLFGLCLGWWTPFGDWRTTEDACVVEVIDQPVSVENPNGTQAAYLGGCETVTCPGAEPVTECCTGENVFGAQTCETVDPNAELTPYDPPESIWEALEWLLTLPGSGEVPAGWEGPWRFYLFTSATEGR